MSTRICRTNMCKDKDGNCLIPGLDGLPVQYVGSWVEDKYFFLERYLQASREARKKFAEKGNAVFIDLFAGPGRCIIKNDMKEIDSGGTRAFKIEVAPFNEYFFFDISETNAEALRTRNGDQPNYHVKQGDSNVLIFDLVKELLKHSYRYHFAFIDPFGPEGLKFNTLKELAKLNRMDMLIHFPIGAIKRNLNTWEKSKNTILDGFLGTDSWRNEVKTRNKPVFNVLIDIFKEQFKSIGYPEDGLRMIASDKAVFSGVPSVSIRNTKNVDLYVLILAAKHKLAQKIWNSIIRIDPDGQTHMF